MHSHLGCSLACLLEKSTGNQGRLCVRTSILVACLSAYLAQTVNQLTGNKGLLSDAVMKRSCKDAHGL